MGKIIGIDLGTTNSVVAEAGGPQPRILDSKEGLPHTPSVVGLHWQKKRAEGLRKTLVGKVALDNWPMSPHDTIVSVKRLMGRGSEDEPVLKMKELVKYKIVKPSDGTKDSVRVVMGGEEYSPAEVSAQILSKVKKDAEYRLGDTVTHAVITVPAYFSQIQKDATRQAALKAGLTVIKILDEPTAVAVAFGMESQESSEPKKILVYDLGGGTFDVSVLLWAGNVFAPLDLEGDMWLGGDNFDQTIVDYAVQRIRKEHGIDPTQNDRFMVQLKIAARKAKEELSSLATTEIIIAGSHLRDADGDPVDVAIEVERKEFMKWITPLVERTARLIMKALVNAGLKDEQGNPDPRQIDYVLLAGNASCVPLVQHTVERIFGPEKVLKKMHPKHCVALGAAIVATRIGERTVCQAPHPSNPDRECGHVNPSGATSCERCGAPLPLAEEGGDSEESLVLGGIAPFHYGAQTAGDTFNIFVHKGDPFPTQNPATQTFYTRRPNQRMVSIPVYGGENLQKASANEKQGEAFAILPPGLPEGTALRVKIWLDSNGVFELAAYLDNGTDLAPWTLKGEADHRAVEAIQEVEEKLHQQAQAISPQEREKLEAAREQAFEMLKAGKFHDAIRCAEDFAALVDEMEPAGAGDSLTSKAEGLIRFTQFVIGEFGWALEAEKAYSLNTLVAETQKALQSSDRGVLEQKVEELDAATDDLPDVVKLLLGMRNAIEGRIRPVDPAKAGRLLEELVAIERGLKAGEPNALGRLNAYAEKLVRAVTVADGARPLGAQCKSCGAQLNGKRHCPKCGADSWIVDNKKSLSSGGIG